MTQTQFHDLYGLLRELAQEVARVADGLETTNSHLCEIADVMTTPLPKRPDPHTPPLPLEDRE